VKDNLKRWNTGALRRPTIDKPFSDLIISRPARGTERKIAPHPSLKPQSFVRQLVWACLPLGSGIILDPFMGSGSTIAAAQYLGFRSIGLEVDREYYILAKQAISKLAELELNGAK
jgi:site-specific DNA-methyltransferase (adenine-specific)